MKAELQEEPVSVTAESEQEGIHVPEVEQQVEAELKVNGSNAGILGSPDELYSGSGSSSTTCCDDEVQGPVLDPMVRDWISVEDGSTVAGSCLGQRQGVSCEFPAGWVAVEAPTGSPSTSNKASCSSPVEWVTVDVPTSKDKASSTQEELFGQTGHESWKTEAPRTRRRRTISAKIRARIEAFENSFRQELDRLNSPIVKSRRIHEALRSTDARASDDLKAQIEQLSLVDDKMMGNLDTIDLPEGSWLAPTTADQVFKPEQSCQADLIQQEKEDKEEGEEGEVKSIGEPLAITQGRTQVATSVEQTSTTAAENCDEAGEEQAVCTDLELMQTEEVTNLEALEASKEFHKHAAERGVGAGAFMKQVISGAALLAGLIFLWPRGNNLIWRNSQKKQRYYLVKSGASHKKDRRYGHPVGKMNFERLKG